MASISLLKAITTGYYGNLQGGRPEAGLRKAQWLNSFESDTNSHFEMEIQEKYKSNHVTIENIEISRNLQKMKNIFLVILKIIGRKFQQQGHYTQIKPLGSNYLKLINKYTMIELSNKNLHRVNTQPKSTARQVSHKV